MGRIREISGVASFYTAAFIGAGFASGEEIQAFFVRYGLGGLVGIPLSIAVLVLGSGLVLEQCKRLGVGSYSEFFHREGGRLGRVYDTVYSVFALTGLGVMLAGCGALARSLVGLPGGALATAVAVGLTIWAGPGQILRLSSILTPVMATVLVVPTLGFIVKEGITLPTWGSHLGIPAAVLYASYNLSFSMAVWASFHDRLKTRGELWAAALLGNGPVGILLFVLSLGLWAVPPGGGQSEIPILVIARAYGPLVTGSFAAILHLAMFSTALAHGYALTLRVKLQTTLETGSATALVLGAGLALSAFGFSALVRLGYPIVGLMGMLIFGTLLGKGR